MAEQYPTRKIIEGWMQIADDYEYGPTPIIYVGGEKGLAGFVPYRSAKTACECLDDKKWEELELFPSDGNDAWRVKITIEVFEGKKLEEKEDW